MYTYLLSRADKLIFLNHGLGPNDQIEQTDAFILSSQTVVKEEDKEGGEEDDLHDNNNNNDNKKEKEVVKWEKIDETKKPKSYQEGIRNEITMLNGFVR